MTLFLQNFQADVSNDPGVPNDPGLSLMIGILTNQERIEINSYNSRLLHNPPLN